MSLSSKMSVYFFIRETGEFPVDNVYINNLSLYFTKILNGRMPVVE